MNPIKPTPFELAMIAIELSKEWPLKQLNFDRALAIWVASKTFLDAIILPLPGKESERAETDNKNNLLTKQGNVA